MSEKILKIENTPHELAILNNYLHAIFNLMLENYFQILYSFTQMHVQHAQRTFASTCKSN